MLLWLSLGRFIKFSCGAGSFPSWLSHGHIVFFSASKIWKLNCFAMCKLFYGCLWNLQSSVKWSITPFVYLRSKIVRWNLLWYSSSIDFFKFPSRFLSRIFSVIPSKVLTKVTSAFLQCSINTSIILNEEETKVYEHWLLT